jgi:formiminotetrahydrofolate cyclodeaminase
LIDPVRLDELTVGDLAERLASAEPIPGGGSAAAIGGALGAALVRMVVELSIGRPAHASDEEALREIGLAASGWQSELLNLANQDAAAYASVVRARRLPRDSDLERTSRATQVSAAVRDATRVPLRIVEIASHVLDLAVRLAPIGNPRAASDAGVAAQLASAAMRGAALNVRINLPSLATDDVLRDEAVATLEQLLSDVTQREAAVIDAVEARIG